MSAIMSECGRYRYRLRRRFSEAETGRVLFIMLNPSTADATFDDPTIRKCVGFARSWGLSEIEVINLFAWRATDPRELTRAVNPVGPENDIHIFDAVNDARLIVAAWGRSVPPSMMWRVEQMREVLLDSETKCLGYTKTGQPRHPLMLAYSTPLELFEARK